MSITEVLSLKFNFIILYYIEIILPKAYSNLYLYILLICRHIFISKLLQDIIIMCSVNKWTQYKPTTSLFSQKNQQEIICGFLLYIDVDLNNIQQPGTGYLNSLKASILPSDLCVLFSCIKQCHSIFTNQVHILQLTVQLRLMKFLIFNFKVKQKSYKAKTSIFFWYWSNARSRWVCLKTLACWCPFYAALQTTQGSRECVGYLSHGSLSLPHLACTGPTHALFTLSLTSTRPIRSVETHTYSVGFSRWSSLGLAISSSPYCSLHPSGHRSVPGTMTTWWSATSTWQRAQGTEKKFRGSSFVCST